MHKILKGIYMRQMLDMLVYIYIYISVIIFNMVIIKISKSLNKIIPYEVRNLIKFLPIN